MKTTVLTTLLAASLALSTLSFAQTGTTTQHASPVAAPTYLGLGYAQGMLQVLTSNTEADNLSPKVQSLVHEDGLLPAGFEAVHINTTLSEVVSYYWNTLSKLGFTLSVKAASGDSVSYSFANGASRLAATFTEDNGSVLADLSWIGAELAATAN